MSIGGQYWLKVHEVPRGTYTTVNVSDKMAKNTPVCTDPGHGMQARSRPPSDGPGSTSCTCGVRDVVRRGANHIASAKFRLPPKPDFRDGLGRVDPVLLITRGVIGARPLVRFHRPGLCFAKVHTNERHCTVWRICAPQQSQRPRRHFLDPSRA